MPSVFSVPISRAIQEIYFDDFRPKNFPKFRPDTIINTAAPTYLNIHHIDWKKDLYDASFFSFYAQIEVQEYPVILQNLLLVATIPYVCYFWFWFINFNKADFVKGSSIVAFHSGFYTRLIIPTVFAVFLSGVVLMFYRLDRNMAYVFFKDPEHRKAVDIWRKTVKEENLTKYNSIFASQPPAATAAVRADEKQPEDPAARQSGAIPAATDLQQAKVTPAAKPVAAPASPPPYAPATVAAVSPSQKPTSTPSVKSVASSTSAVSTASAASTAAPEKIRSGHIAGYAAASASTASSTSWGTQAPAPAATSFWGSWGRSAATQISHASSSLSAASSIRTTETGKKLVDAGKLSAYASSVAGFDKQSIKTNSSKSTTSSYSSSSSSSSKGWFKSSKSSKSAYPAYPPSTISSASSRYPSSKAPPAYSAAPSIAPPAYSTATAASSTQSMQTAASSASTTRSSVYTNASASSTRTASTTRPSASADAQSILSSSTTESTSSSLHARYLGSGLLPGHENDDDKKDKKKKKKKSGKYY